MSPKEVVYFVYSGPNADDATAVYARNEKDAVAIYIELHMTESELEDAEFFVMQQPTKRYTAKLSRKTVVTEKKASASN